MAYSFSWDERTANLVSYSAGTLDVSDSFWERTNYGNYRGYLVENVWAYGELTYDNRSAIAVKDVDVYELGNLATGVYLVDVDDQTWDSGNFDPSSVSSFSLLDSFGSILETQYGTYTDITFTVSTPSEYYVSIDGPVALDAQYSIKYSKISELAGVNSPAVWGTPTYTGNLNPGEVLDGFITVDDANGNSDNVVLTGWFIDGVSQGASETFALTSAEVGKIISFNFFLQDDAGNLETSPNYTLGPVTTVNAPAVFSNATLTAGDHYPGRVLSASIDIDDDDGTSGATTAFTWYRSKDNVATEISSSTNNTYTIQSADIGYSIYYRVGFTDDAGNSEISGYLGHASIIVAASNNPPTISTATSITTNEDTPTAPIAFSASDADGDALTYSFSDPAKGSITNNNNGTYTYTPDADANGSDSFTITFSDGTVNVTETVNVTVNAVNDVPVNGPTITGTATEGQTLTAVTSSIYDADVPGSFSYQWLRDGSAISGATSSSYVLTSDDVGAAVSVTVSYTDGGGTSESIVSQPSATVVAAQALDDFVVNTSRSGEQSHSEVAVMSDGKFVVAWRSASTDGDGYGISAQIYSEVGAALGSEIQINQTVAGHQTNVQVTELTDVGFAATWTSFGQDGDQGGIYAAVYNSSGNTLVTEFQVNSTTNGNQGAYWDGLSLDQLSNGNMVFAWNSDQTTNNSTDVYGKIISSAGVTVVDEFILNSTLSSLQSDPKVTATQDGGFITVWQSYDPGGTYFDIKAQKFSAEGVMQGSEFTVNTETASQQISPEVTELSNGDYVIVWASAEQDTATSYGIFGQMFEADGTAKGSEFQVNSYVTDSQNSPSLTALGDGGFVVSWNSFGQDGSNFGVYAQKFNASGTKEGTETRLTQDTEINQMFASLDATDDGNFVASWHSNYDGSEFTPYDIYANIFDGDTLAALPIV